MVAAERQLLMGLGLRCPTCMTAQFYNHPLQNADLIFVLAGREYRKRFGLDLFNQELAPRILLSVARFEIRRFSKLSLPVPVDLLDLASNVPPPQRHFFVLFERQQVQVEHVRPGRLGTLTEIQALAHWLADHPEIHSLLIVSSEGHLRRITLCCQYLLDSRVTVELIASPNTDSGKRESKTPIAVLVELLKVLFYRALLGLRLNRCWGTSKHRRRKL